MDHVITGFQPFHNEQLSFCVESECDCECNCECVNAAIATPQPTVELAASISRSSGTPEYPRRCTGTWREPARVIGETARERNVDVVVMATHGSGGLSRLLLGSVATIVDRQE